MSPSTKITIEQLSLPVEILDKMSRMTFTEVYMFFSHIDMKVEDVLYEFYKVSQSSPDKVRSYDHIMEWGTASSNYRHRFAIFKVGDDYVMSAIKIVSPRGKARYFNAWCPVSLNKNKDHEVLVLQKLSKIRDVRYFLSLYGNENDYWEDNYYNDVESASYLWKSKYRSKYSINKLSNLLKMRDTNTLDDNTISSIQEINKHWEYIKNEVSTNYADMNLIKMMNKGCDSIRVMLVYYQDKIVSFSIMSIYMGRYAVALTTKACSVLGRYFLQDYLKCDEETATLLAKKLDKYHHYMMHYHYLKECPYQAVYYLNDMKRPGLIEYKKSMFKRCIYYSRIENKNIKDFRDLYNRL